LKVLAHFGQRTVLPDTLSATLKGALHEGHSMRMGMVARLLIEG
jgi:hypothetical protein